MIVFDVRALQSPAFGTRGIGRYVADLATALDTHHRGVVSAFCWNDQLERTDALRALDLGNRLVPVSELPERVDIFHVNAPFEDAPLPCVLPAIRSDALVVTCYDLIPYRFADRYLVDRRVAARYRMRLGLLATADRVVTDSVDAADDVEQLIGVERRRIRPIGAGTADRFRPPANRSKAQTEAKRRIDGLGDQFVLVPGGMDWRKNIDGAIRAFGDLPPDARQGWQLAVVCDLDEVQRRRLGELAGASGVGDDVLFTGAVTDDDLVLLYQSAELVFFPSFTEGFGLPVLEARRCGAPVICSGVSSLPEVLPEPSAHFDPWNRADVAASLERAVVDADHRSRLAAIRDSGHTWQATARALVRVYGELSRSAIAA